MQATDWPVNQPGDTVILDAPVDMLTSFHYFKDVDISAIASWGCRIIGDSGGFSAMSTGAEIDREEFHAWAQRWSDSLFWTAALDVIGDPAASLTNWKASLADGVSLVPTVHYGATPDALDPYIEAGADFIGLGGMVPYSGEPDRLMRWLIPMFKHARDHAPHVRFHGWGISHPRLVDRLPWWSTDSSGYSSAFRFGSLRLFNPKTGTFSVTNLDGRALAKDRVLLADHYGVKDWRTISTSTPLNRREVGRVALRAVQLYSRWLRTRQKVTPPASLAARTIPTIGPVSVAAASDTDLRWINPGHGPLNVAALDAPSMQPTKSINPADSDPPKAITTAKGTTS